MKENAMAMMIMDKAIKGRRNKKKVKKKVDPKVKDKAIKKQEEENYREVSVG